MNARERGVSLDERIVEEVARNRYDAYAAARGITLSWEQQSIDEHDRSVGIVRSVLVAALRAGFTLERRTP